MIIYRTELVAWRRVAWIIISVTSVGVCVADTNTRGQLMLILGTMHNFEKYAIVIKKNDGAIF